MAGARSFRQRLLWGSLLGAVLLLFADALVLLAARFIGEVPTGTITAISGAIIMLLMLKSVPPAALHGAAAARLHMVGATTTRFILPLSIALLVLVAAFSLSEEIFSAGIDRSVLLSGRWPRVLTSAAAGAMLALAGSVTQAITGNPMASPEGLGVSGGAGLGIIAAFFLGGMASPLVPLAGGVCGAVVAFAIIMAVAKRRSFAPGPVLLAGVAVGALVTAVISLIVASGDPRAAYILAWTMGPTFRATSIVAIISAVLGLVAIGLSPLFRRWLELLPLGDITVRSLGVRPGTARGILLLYVATLTAAATLIVGPLSFVGLMAPHIARMTAPRGPMSATLTAGAIGALLMTVADWLGRSVDFPYEIPAGVLAAFIGGPYFLWVVYRQGGGRSAEV
jgi:iron complex transport system permease protein